MNAATEGRLKRAGADSPILTAAREKALKPKPRTGAAREVERSGGLSVFIDLGGDLSIDGAVQGTIRPGRAYVDDKIPAGPHVIEIRKDGYETIQENIIILPDQTTNKTYRMAANLPTAARLDRVYGLIQVSVDRGGTLYIDDKKEADLPPFGPYTTPRIDAGPHRLRIEKPGFVTIDQEIMVRPNDTARVDLSLKAIAAAAIPANSPASAPADRPASTSARDAATGIEFVKIQPGEFMMGCSAGDSQCYDDEKPAHRVRITKGFDVGKYEVTQAQWESVMGSNPSYFKGADRPVESVSWNDAQTFLQKLNSRNDGHRYRLPTEAEWEYAARAGSTGANPGSLDSIGWYGNNSGRSVLDAGAIWRTDQNNYGKRLQDNGNQTHQIGQKQPNAWGLYDVIGNVLEWVQDWYDQNYYKSSPASDPAGPSSGQTRVLRGGSWYYLSRDARVSGRYDYVPANWYGVMGFRCVREAIP